MKVKHSEQEPAVKRPVSEPTGTSPDIARIDFGWSSMCGKAFAIWDWADPTATVTGLSVVS